MQRSKSEPGTTGSQLFSPLTVRGVTLPNRIMISPMCMYSAHEGKVNDFHLVHLGRYALGGAGLVMAEALAVEARGRISPADAGLWSDEQIEPWRRITSFLREHGAVPGIQLAHAGRKASTQAPWRGAGQLTERDAREGNAPWQTVAPTALPASADLNMPAELSVDDIRAIVAAWRDAAARALSAGFKVIEVHGAHGYLIHTFLSPLSNLRSDGYGGDRKGRMRFALEIACAIREVWPPSLPLFWRVSALDGVEGGWTLDDTVALCRELAEHGVDVIDTSSGGVSNDPESYRRIRKGYGFHTPYAAQIRRETGLRVATVGLIVDPVQAEGIVRRGDADIVAIAREALANPQWPLQARQVLVGESYDTWPVQAGWWLERRAPVLRRLEQCGDDPRQPRYETPIDGTQYSQEELDAKA